MPGYSNYATDAVAITIDNNQLYLNSVKTAAAYCLDYSGPDRTPEGLFADWLMEYVESLCGEDRKDFEAVLFHAGFSQVNWMELAHSYIGDVLEEREK